MNLSCFQEEMMVKEDPINIGKEELEKEADQENSATVDRPLDYTQWAIDRLSIAHNGRSTCCRSHSTEKKRGSDFRQAAANKPVNSRSGLSTARGPESD